MKLNKIILLVFLASSSLLTHAQLLDDVFISKMPENILPTLSKDIRTNILSNYYAGQKDTVRNIFDNKVYAVDFDSINHYISVQTAQNAQFEMKLFPTKENIDSTSYIIGVIKTVCAPICSSYISFYDNNWSEIPVNFPVWQAADWLKDKNQVVDGVKLADIFNSTFVELHFDKPTNQITVKNNSADLLSVEDKLFVQPYLKDDVKTERVKISGNSVAVSR